jgi:hypothetical protein
MRVAACVLVLAFSLPVGCGGGTPAPKNEETATNGSKSDDASAEDGGAAPAAPVASEAPAAPAPTDTSAPAPAPAAAPAPKADDPWMAAHEMPSNDVLKTIKPSKTKMQACFKAGKKRDKSVSGDVKIKFIIAHDGKVRDWKDDASSMTDEKVTKCVAEVIRKLKFPKQKSPGDAWGSYSINFK